MKERTAERTKYLKYSEEKQEIIMQELKKIEQIRKTRNLTEEEVVEVLKTFGPVSPYKWLKRCIILSIYYNYGTLSLDQKLELSNMLFYNGPSNIIVDNKPSVHENVKDKENPIKERQNNASKHALIVTKKIMDMLEAQQELSSLPINIEFPSYKQVEKMVKRFISMTKETTNNQFVERFKKLYNSYNNDDLMFIDYFMLHYLYLANEMCALRKESIDFYLDYKEQDSRFERFKFNVSPLTYDDIKLVLGDKNYTNLETRVNELVLKYTVKTPPKPKIEKPVDISKDSVDLFITVIDILKKQSFDKLSMYRFTTTDCLILLKDKIDEIIEKSTTIRDYVLKLGFSSSEIFRTLSFIREAKLLHKEAKGHSQISYLIKGKTVIPTEQDYNLVYQYLHKYNLPINESTIGVIMARLIKGHNIESKFANYPIKDSSQDYTC